MLGLPWRGALPWVLLLLLLGFQLPLIHAWHFHEQRDCDEYNVMARYLPATVEFAVHTFNQQSKDHYAYRLVHILNSWKEQVGDHIPSCPGIWYMLLSENGSGVGVEGLIEESCSPVVVHT